MGEWKRIISDRRRCAAVLGVLILCFAVFIWQGYADGLRADPREYRALVEQWRDSSPEEIIESFSDRWLVDENETRLLAQAKYLAEYPAYLERVQEQAGKMQSTSLFGGDPDSFVYRNIVKTAEDFARCSAEGLSLGNDRAIQSWMSFSWADWGFLAVIVLLVMSFQEERQKGLAAIVRSCPAGRGKLQGMRLLILLAYSVGMTLLLYGLPLAASFSINGGWEDIARPVQTLAVFQKCTAQLSILKFLAEYFLIKAACGFLLGVLIWVLISFLGRVQLCWLMTAAGLVVEYLLYALIPAQSVFSPLRYLNVFSYVFTSELYTGYVNINFLSFPVGRRELLLVLLAVLSAVLSGAVVFLLPKRRPFGNRDRLGMWLRLWDRAGDALRRRLGLYGFEWYKLLFLTAGGLVLLLGGMLCRDLPVNSGAYNDLDNAVYRQYVAQVQGPVTQSTFDYIAKSRASLDASQLTDTADFYEALDRMEQTLSDLNEGDWLVDETAFLNIYGENAWFAQRNTALAALLILTACLADLFSAEQSGDVRKLLRSTPGGRNRLFWTKYTVALSATAVVWLLVFVQEWHSASQMLGETILAAPCGSIPVLKGYPGTVKEVLFWLCLSKGALLLIPMHLCIFVSERSGSFEKSFLIGGGVILIPAAVGRFVEVPLRAVTPLSFFAEKNPLLAGADGVVWLCVWGVLSLAALLAARRNWCRIS